MGLFDGKGGGGLMDQVGEGALAIGTGGLSELIPQTSNFGAKAVNGVINGVKGGLSEMNPFHKIDTTAAPTLQAPQQVQGPGAAPKVGNVDAPQAQYATGVGAASSNAFRQAQLNQINGLQGIASGEDHSAQQMLQMQTQQNVANQFAMANSARPGQQALAMRSAMNNASQMNTQANVQGANMALQQRMQAAGLIGNIAGQGSGQDISVAGQNASLGTQASIAGGQQGTQRAIAQGQVDTTTNGQNLQAGIANQGAGLQHDAQLQSQWKDVNGLNSQNEAARRQGIGNFVGGVAGAITGMPLGSMLGGGDGGGGMGINGSTGEGSNSFSGGTNSDFMGPPAMAHGGIVPTPQGIHIPYSLLLKRIVGGK